MPQKEIEYDDTYLESLKAEPVPEISGEFDPDAEYNRPAPPVEDGWYQMTFSNGGVYVEGAKRPFRKAKWANRAESHMEINVTGTIIAPDNSLIDGKYVYTLFPLTTTPDEDHNWASGVSAAYLALTGKPFDTRDPLKQVEMLDAVLKGQPVAWGEVQNVLNDDDAAKLARTSGGEKVKAVYGQKKIMQLKGGMNAAGKFTGAADHPQTKTRCVSKPGLNKFKPAAWEGPTKK